MTDVFISYSRRDKDFVQILYDALLHSKYDTWVDWEDIKPTTEWWEEIKAGIEEAHTFIFVISPDSAVSEYCRKEAEHADQHHKRIIPVVRRDCEGLPAVLSKIQWLLFREEDDFESAFNTLVETINSDLEHKKAHTRLEVRAIEWQRSKSDGSLLLRGSDLDKAEQWLLQSSAGKEPKPTELQGKYIAASRKGNTRRQRVIVGALSSLLLLALGAGGYALIQSEIATEQSKLAQFERERAEDALTESEKQRQIAEDRQNEAEYQKSQTELVSERVRKTASDCRK